MEFSPPCLRQGPECHFHPSQLSSPGIDNAMCCCTGDRCHGLGEVLVRPEEESVEMTTEAYGQARSTLNIHVTNVASLQSRVTVQIHVLLTIMCLFLSY